MKYVLGASILAVLLTGIISFSGCTSSGQPTADTDNSQTEVAEDSGAQDTTTDTAAITPAATAGDNITNPLILIEYFPQMVLQANTGNVLVVNIDIQNLGYRTFYTDPGYFSVSTATGNYPYDPSLSSLRKFDVPNGGKVLGMISFPVSESEFSQTSDYTLEYNGKHLYNIEWVERTFK